MDRAIILSNGRCGSTLLSDLIREEAETCSAQEFFHAMAPWSRGQLLTGAEYWSVLSSMMPELAVLFRLGMPPSEVHYPTDGRWAGRLGELPRILAVTLPKLTADPDALFDRLAERVPSFPLQSVPAHHQAFLDLCASTLGSTRWVERSGGSTQWAPALLSDYPNIRFVYLTRNWPDTASSMSRHASFQLVQLRVEIQGRYGIDLFRLEDGQSVPPEVEPFLPERLTVDLLRERGADVNRYVGFCAFLTAQTEQALIDTPPRHLWRLTYEDLVLDPVGQLTALGTFLGFAEPQGWAAKVAHRVRPPAGTRPLEPV